VVSDAAGIKPNLTVVGLDSRSKQRHFAAVATRRTEWFDLEQARLRLKQIRSDTLADMDSLRERFARQVIEQDTASLCVADDAAAAVAYIARTVGPKRALAVNRASVIGELRPLLKRSGYKEISTYLAGLPRQDGAEKVLNHYWQLPFVPPASVYQSFAVQDLDPIGGRRDYTAVLGVTAAAAEDGSLYFLQHTANVGKMLQEARQLILVVGLEKIVGTRDEALLQTKCMGTFGLESVILGLKCPARSREAEQLDALPLNDLPPEIHLILLDNGRRRIAGDARYSELLTCISCRACMMHCPTHEYFDPGGSSYPKQYLWSFLLGNNESLDLCTGCGMCSARCPLDIDIPRMVSTARGEDLGSWPPMIKNRLLHDAYPLMLTASRLGPLVNFSLRNRLVRAAMEGLSGYQRDAWVPKARNHTFNQQDRAPRNKRDGS
jgi:L-lactate utilization protein LutB